MTARLLEVFRSIASLFRFQRSHVDGEPVLHIGFEQSLVCFVDFLNRNDFDFSSDVMFAAKIEHLLRLGDASDGRAGETAPSRDQGERCDVQWFSRSADKSEISIASKQIDIGVDVVIGGNGVENEIEAAGVLLHFVAIAGYHN